MPDINLNMKGLFAVVAFLFGVIFAVEIAIIRLMNLAAIRAGWAISRVRFPAHHSLLSLFMFLEDEGLAIFRASLSFH